VIHDPPRRGSYFFAAAIAHPQVAIGDSLRRLAPAGYLAMMAEV